MKWQNSLCFGLACALLTCLISMNGYAEETEGQPTAAPPVKTLEEYQRDGITLASSSQWEPFTFLDESDERAGYLVDLWEKWSEKTGIPIRFVYSELPESLEHMKNGTADVHAGLYVSEDLDQFLDFSEPIQSSSSVLALHPGSEVDCSNALFAGSVAVLNKTYSHEFILRNYPEVEVRSYPDAKQAVSAFLKGDTDAIVIDYASLKGSATEMQAWRDVSVCRTLFYRSVFAAVPEGNEELLEIVNNGFADITQEELQVIEGRWFVTMERKLEWRAAVLPAAVALLFIGGVVYIWVGRRS